MSLFVSKVQYRICEDGEYYEEKARDLAGTIQLINDFPWFEQRHAEIDYTCPSVTIMDNDKNWFKLGNYYGRFCVYYLSSSRIFYERSAINMDDALLLVSEFFNGSLNLETFERPFLGGIGKKRYFITKDFNYRVNPWHALIYTFWIGIFVLLFSVFFILNLTHNPPIASTSFLAIMILLSAVTPIYCFIKMLNYKGQHLHISKANHEFTFGDNRDENQVYHKSDVVRITTIASKNTKEPIEIQFLQLDFVDGSSVRFPNLLITGSELMDKFPSNLHPEWITVQRYILLEL